MTPYLYFNWRCLYFFIFKNGAVMTTQRPTGRRKAGGDRKRRKSWRKGPEEKKGLKADGKRLCLPAPKMILPKSSRPKQTEHMPGKLKRCIWYFFDGAEPKLQGSMHELAHRETRQRRKQNSLDSRSLIGGLSRNDSPPEHGDRPLQPLIPQGRHATPAASSR
jgi:hypothetical protein